MIIDFDKLIDQHIEREYHPKGVGKYYPSEAGTCMRKAFYSYKYPTETEPELQKIFEMGNIVHDFIVNVLKSSKQKDVELLKAELPFREKFEDIEISGRVDDVILVKASGKTYVVEVKSSKSIDYIREASPHNIQQLQLYMHFTGIHNGILLYVDKTNLQTKSFEISYNEAEAKKILERFKLLHKHLTEETLPEAEARAHENIKWMCNYCEYKDRCYGDTPRAMHEG
jgi:CRISPR-associated exonuclease Cas4